MAEITTNEALLRIVIAIESQAKSLKSIDESLDSISDFFVTMDVAAQEHGDAERASLATVLRAYRKATAELEAGGDEGDGNEPG